MHDRDLIRIGMILFILAVNGVLSHYSGEPPKGVPRILRAVKVGSYTTLAMAAILWARATTFGRETVKNLPQLNVRAAVLYVYGLGILVFVTVYCLLDLSGACTWYFATVTGLSVQDMLERLREPRGRLILLGLSSLFALNVFAFRYGYLPDPDEIWNAYQQGRTAEVVYGFCLPVLAPFVFLGVRGRRHYTPLTVMEFIHLAMPSAVLMAVMSLLVTSALPNLSCVEPFLANISSHNASLTDTLVEQTRLVSLADVTVPLLSLMMIPTLFFCIQTVLLYSTVDFLAPAAAVAVFRHIAEDLDTSATSFIIMAEGFMAIFVRVYVCFRDDSSDAGVLYTTEVELEDSLSPDEAAKILLRELDTDVDTAIV